MSRRTKQAENEGRCRVCWCTDEDACPGGCAWVDDAHTLCDSPTCVEMAPVLDAARELLRSALQGSSRLKPLRDAITAFDEHAAQFQKEIQGADL